MSSLYHPAPGFTPGFLFDVLCFLASCTDMSCIPELTQNIADFIIIISLIETHFLRSALCRPWSSDRHAFDSFFRHFEVVPVCPIDGYTNRYAMSISEQAAFCPLFCAVCWVWTTFFFPRAVTWSSLRPWIANPSQCFLNSHTGAVPFSIFLQTLLP